MKIPKTFTFNGRRYDLFLDKVDGMCDPPRQGGRPNFIITGGLQPNRKTMECLIHEAMHASNWDLTEETVERMAHELARFLWYFYEMRKDK